MQIRNFGKSSIEISVLGIGGGQVGEAAKNESAVAHVVNAALDLGATLHASADPGLSPAQSSSPSS